MAAISSVIVSAKNDINTNPVGNKKRMKKETTREVTPTKVAITRRNARERNRVKQVNNGFLTLRQHIPTDIAAAYENGRSNNKKLSKVETLRMAVEYIRSLKEILSSDRHLEENELVSTDTSVTYQQYVLIPGTDTYRLSNTFDYEDEENIKPINSDAVELPLAEKGLDDSILYSNVGSPYSQKSSVCSPGYGADGLMLPPIEVLYPRSVIQNNLLIQQPTLPSNQSIHINNRFGSNLTLFHHQTSEVSSLSNSSCDSSDFIKSETLSDDHSEFNFRYSDVKTEEETIDVMDWWENHSKLTVIQS